MKNFDFYEQTDAFRFELDDLCRRYLEEFDINTFTLIGALEEKKLEVLSILHIIEEKKIELLGEDIEFEVDEDFFD
jgi:hypothetical protein